MQQVDNLCLNAQLSTNELESANIPISEDSESNNSIEECNEETTGEE